MQNDRCPKCGHETAPDVPCSECGQTAVNGVARPSPVKPPPPPEAASWAIEPVPPEVRDHFRRTFDEAEHLASVREMEKTGGFRLEDFIDEIERIANGSE